MRDRNLWHDDHDEDEQLKITKTIMKTSKQFIWSTVCPEKSEPPKHFALTSANMPRIEQN